MTPVFCKVEAEITVDGKVVKSKVWPECDIMKTSVTRAWATRQFNLFLKEYARGGVELSRDKIIRAEWVATYGEAQGHTRLTGVISGVNGHVMARRGMFEPVKSGP
jgi:hypothetical protein